MMCGWGPVQTLHVCGLAGFLSQAERDALVLLVPVTETVSSNLFPHVSPMMNYWRAKGGSSHLSSCQLEKTDDNKFALRLWNFGYNFKFSFPKSVFPPESPDWTGTSFCSSSIVLLIRIDEVFVAVGSYVFSSVGQGWWNWVTLCGEHQRFLVSPPVASSSAWGLYDLWVLPDKQMD